MQPSGQESCDSPEREVNLPSEPNHFPRWARPVAADRSRAWRYGISIATVLAATGVRLAIEPHLGPYLPFLMAVMVAALLGGRAPGITAAALSILSVLVLRSLHVSAHLGPHPPWRLAAYAGATALIAWLVGSLRESFVARAKAGDTLLGQARLIDLSHDAVITMDIRRRIITWNKGAEEIYGWPERQAAGRLIHELLRTVSSIPLRDINELLLRERRWEGEMRQVARDGRPLVVESRQVLLGDGLSSEFRLLAINRDITARKEIEESLRESEQQFRTLANTIPQLCGMAHPDGSFFWVNRRWCDYTGLTADQSQGWDWQSALDPEASRDGLQDWRRAIATGSEFESILAVRGADGAVRPFLARARPLRDREGRIARWFGTLTDISAQRKIEDDLRRSHEEERARAAELQAMMDAMPVAVFLSRDPECRNIIGNRAACRLFRRPPGSNLSQFSPAGERLQICRLLRSGVELPHSELPMQKAAATGRPTVGSELEAVFEDGSVLNLIGNAVPLPGPEGRPRGAVGVFADITEHKKTEERLRQVQKLESIGVLAGGVAHDFNNLLTVIAGNAEIALRQYPSCTVLESVIQASEQAAHLTRQLLAYAGKDRSLSETFDLSDLVIRAWELLSASVPKGIELVSHLSGQALPVHADPSQIEQVLLNLVINAGESMPPDRGGRVEITTSACEIAPARARAHAPEFDVRTGPFVCLEVADNGCGMDRATLARIFEPFFSTKFTGRGLGLAAVQGIVRTYNGFIEVRSSPGGGSIFRVYLPAAVTQPAETPHARPPDTPCPP
ncbi:MAG TPA: PAS domain S-box protein [Bryobacteraceae bacterium]|nr:PAS domain S-box protein [Bryobacteraceae bacterium]